MRKFFLFILAAALVAGLRLPVSAAAVTGGKADQAGFSAVATPLDSTDPDVDATAPTGVAASTVESTEYSTPAPSAAAQPGATSTPDYELNAVVITGTKSKLKILDSPAQVEIVNQKDLQKKDIGFFDDALTGLPGVSVDKAGGIGSQAVTVSLRGIPGWEKNLILLDGFELNQLGNERPFWNRIPEDLVDHVEIVEGPFSALWGRNAIGGVINVITKEPEGELFNFREDWNSANARTTNVDYANKTSDGLFSYYLGFQNTGIDGYTYNQFVQAKAAAGAPTETVTGFQTTENNTGATVYNIGQVARTVMENNNYTAKLYFDPAKDQDFNLLVNYSYWDQPNTNQTGQVGTSWLKDSVTGSPATVLNGTVSLSGTGQVIKVNESNFLTAPGKNGFFGSYLQYKGKANDNLNLTGSFAWTAGPLHIAEAGVPVGSSAFSGTNTGTDMEADWEAFGNLQADQKLDNHDLIVGFNWDQADFTSYNLKFSNWTDIDSYTENLQQGNGDNETTTSLFAQDQWKIAPSLTAFLGGRWDHWVSADGMLYNTITATEEHFGTVSFDEFSPKASLVYKLDANGSLRASLGKSFNPPISADLYLFSSGTNTETDPNPNLQPEIDTAWEFGGEYKLPTETTVSATYFNNSLANLIYLDTETVGVSQISKYYNAGQAQINGITAEVKQKVASDWEASANYTYLDDKIISNTAQPLSVGKQIPTIPTHTVNVELDYEPKDWIFALTGTYQSKRFTTAANTDVVSGVQGSLDGFTTANFKAVWKFNGGNLSLGVDNIFNKQYYAVYQTIGTSFNLGAGFYIL